MHDPLPIAASFTEILPGVLRWAAFSPFHKVELASHAVASPEGWTVFDPIPLAPSSSPPWGLDRQRLRLVITNANHWRDWAAWREHADVWASAEPDFSPHQVARLAPDSAPPGWAALPLPGGAPGETALFDARRGLMVFGDALVNLPGRGLEVLPAKYCEDPSALRRSLAALPAFTVALLAHGDPLLAEASARLRALL